MLKRFMEQVDSHRLCTKDDKILLAVSGGVDSMVMAHLFHKSGYSIGIAHCNFQLRSEDSDDDETFVKNWCNEFNITFHSTRFNTNNYAAEKGVSIQMAARDLRYAWFNDLVEQNNYSLLATAHQLNDNIETTLLNLVRGTGLSGLRGIPLNSNKIIRPLLNFSKNELIQYATENKIDWREDVSNETNDYDRNFIRHEVLPKLQKLNPSLESSFRKTNQRLLGAESLFQLGLDGLKQDFLVVEKGKIKLDKAFLLATSHPVAVTWELIKEYGFNYSQCQDMVKASQGNSGKIFVSPSHQLIIDRDVWMINPHQRPFTEITIVESDKEVTLGKYDMTLERISMQALSNDPFIAMFDADKVHFPMIWRGWKKGDSFMPLGMDNRKKLSDFFIDIKLSVVGKQEATVIEIGGEIAWVVGHRIDNRFKVTNQTKEVIRMTVHPHL